MSAADRSDNEAESDDSILRPIDASVLDVLIRNHRQFRAFLGKRVGSEAIADDLLQASLRKAIENPADATNEASVVAWFYRILKNSLIDHYRGRAAEERKHDAFLQELLSEGRDHERAADDLEAAICKCMDGLLPTLKESYAELIRRIDLQSEPISDVARDLGISENNLSVRLHRARSALKASLERACGTCTEHGCLNCTCE